jgi:hypothetical protein
MPGLLQVILGNQETDEEAKACRKSSSSVQAHDSEDGTLKGLQEGATLHSELIRAKQLFQEEWTVNFSSSIQAVWENKGQCSRPHRPEWRQ